MISVKEHERQRYEFDPTTFCENDFWNRRLNCIVIYKNHQALYILKVKRSSDGNEDFLGSDQDEANEQHKSIIKLSKRLPWNGQLNRLILWKGFVLQ